MTGSTATIAKPPAPPPTERPRRRVPLVATIAVAALLSGLFVTAGPVAAADTPSAAGPVVSDPLLGTPTVTPSGNPLIALAHLAPDPAGAPGAADTAPVAEVEATPGGQSQPELSPPPAIVLDLAAPLAAAFDGALQPAASSGRFKLGAAVVDLLGKQLNIPVGDGNLNGTLNGSTLTVTLAPPSALAVPLPAGLAPLQLGNTALTVDVSSGALTVAVEASAGGTDPMHAKLEVSVQHADAAQIGSARDVDVRLQITGVQLFGTAIDLDGHLSYRVGALSGSLTGTLAADRPVANGAATILKGMSFTLDRTAGLAVAGSLRVGQGAPLVVDVAGTITNARTWSVALAVNATAARWQPVAGLDIAPNFTGTLTSDQGAITFHLAVDEAVAWEAASGLKLSLAHLELANAAVAAGAGCPPAEAGQYWLAATGTLGYDPAKLDLAARVCVNLTARTFRIGADFAGDVLAQNLFRINALALDIDGALATATAGATFSVTGHAQAHLVIAGKALDTGVGVTYQDGVLVAGVRVDNLAAYGFGANDSGTVLVATADVAAFDPKVLFPSATAKPMALPAGVTVAVDFNLPAQVTKALVKMGVPTASATHVLAVAMLTPSGFSLAASLDFGTAADGLDGVAVFRNERNAMYLNRLTLSLQVGTTSEVALGGRATLKLATLSPPSAGTPPYSTVRLDLKASFAFTDGSLKLAFGLSATAGGVWNDALGIPGLSIRALAASVAVVLADGGLPSLAVSATGVSLPPAWADAIGVQRDASLSFDVDTSPTMPFVQFKLEPGSSGYALRPLTAVSTDPAVQSSMQIDRALLRIAPFGGVTAADSVAGSGVRLRPGVQVAFAATVADTRVSIDANFDPKTLSLHAETTLATLKVGSAVTMPNAKLVIDLQPARRSFSFVASGSYSDRGLTLAATVTMSAKPSLAGAGVSLQVAGGLPQYLQLSGSLNGTVVFDGANGLAITANGSGSVVVNGANLGTVSFAYSSSAGMSWKQLGVSANDLAIALKQSNYSADDIARALSGLSFDQASVLNALGAAGFTDQLVASMNSFFHPSSMYIWNVDGQVLDVYQASHAADAPVIQYLWNGGANQKWLWVPTDGNYGELVSVNSGMCLTVAFYSTAPGAGLIQYPCNGHPGQQFRFQDAGGGYSYIKNRNSGFPIEVFQGSLLPTARIDQWYLNQGNHQKFRTTPAFI